MVTRAGFSLAEVVVATALLSIGLLGVAASGLLAARLMREAELRDDVLNRATSALDSLILHDIKGSGILQTQPYRLEWSADVSTASVRAILPDGSRFQLEMMR
ncbi:MAG: prepilin-type N-terminal cleavage/methylation domain-containing protein [Gemmatimonadota bacterium]